MKVIDKWCAEVELLCNRIKGKSRNCSFDITLMSDVLWCQVLYFVKQYIHIHTEAFTEMMEPVNMQGKQTT